MAAGRTSSLVTRLKPLVFAAALTPFGRLIWLGTHDGLSANPVEFVTRSTGTWALVFLCLSLAMTPLRRLTRSGQWIRLRRMLGLFSYFYAVLHFAMWAWIDQALDPLAMGQDVLQRPFIAAASSGDSGSIDVYRPGDLLAVDRSLTDGPAPRRSKRRRQFEPNSPPRIAMMSWRSPSSRTTSRWFPRSK